MLRLNSGANYLGCMALQLSSSDLKTEIENKVLVPSGEKLAVENCCVRIQDVTKEVCNLSNDFGLSLKLLKPTLVLRSPVALQAQTIAVNIKKQAQHIKYLSGGTYGSRQANQRLR